METPTLPLRSSKIVLRDYTSQDVNDYRRWNLPGHSWQKMDAPYFRRSAEMAEHGGFILEEQLRTRELPTPRRRLALSLVGSDRLAGIVSSVWEAPESGWMSAGISLYDEQLWHRGLGFEALVLWTNYLFRGHEHLNRLDVRTWSGNDAMIALAKKAGFQQEACFREARRVDGQLYDALIFGLLRKEWEQSPCFTVLEFSHQKGHTPPHAKIRRFPRASKRFDRPLPD